MDKETLDLLISLGEHGGSVAMLIAVFIGGRASKMAAEAVETLKRIETGLTAGRAESKTAAETAEEKLKDIQRDIETLPLRIFRARNGM
jgi:hypothetical protein